MGLLNEIVGALVAEEALKKAEPDAGLLKEGLAIIAGAEGEKYAENKLREHFGSAEAPPQDGGNA